MRDASPLHIRGFEVYNYLHSVVDSTAHEVFAVLPRTHRLEDSHGAT
jgi:hypothetical protein